MLISHSKRFIFVHIPKTGGSSVERSLLQYARWQERLCLDFWPTRKLIAGINHAMGWTSSGYKQWTGIHKHAPANLIRHKLEPDLFRTYYKFAFVRNPYDRLVSEFFYASPRLPPVNQKSHSAVVDSVLIQSFRAFVRDQAPGRVQPMNFFLQDPRTGESLMNFVGHMETIQSDYRRIQDILGLSLPVLRKSNVSPKRPALPLASWYDKSTAELVVQRYGDDFRCYGYNTDLPESR